MPFRFHAVLCTLAMGLAMLCRADIASCQELVAPSGVTASTRTPVVRGIPGDFWADVELGQRDFTEINERMVVPFKLKQPAGIAVDRSVYPGRLFIWDSGNNRISAVDLADCYGKPFCTTTWAFGQPDFIDWGACNRDSSFATYPLRPPASAQTLCGIGEYTHTVGEDKSYSGMYVDGHGNLWVADVRNHRVLKFSTPFLTDAIADAVWGQADFSGNLCNRQTIYYGPGTLPSPPSIPNASTLCFGEVGAGLTLDVAGNLWVADGGNNRVLRFPNVQGTIAKVADLVIGQPDFNSAVAGNALNQFKNPSQVRFDPAGNLLVLDSLDGDSNARVLRFRPPFVNGMSGENFYTCPEYNLADRRECLKPPVAIEVDQRRNGIWVVINERFNGRPLLYNYDGTLRDGLASLGPSGLGQPVHGSIGIDGNGDLLMSMLIYGQNVYRITETRPGFFQYAPLFTPADGKSNLTASNRLEHPSWGGVAVAGQQLIVADGRLLFWNNRSLITNGQEPDGYVGGTSFKDVPDARAGQPEFGQVKTDKEMRVWVTHSNSISHLSEVRLYQAPLAIGAQPLKILHTLPVLSGGSITLTSAYGIAVTDHSEYLWISQPERHHVIRVRAPLSDHPVVDVILGQSGWFGNEQCNFGSFGSTPFADLNMLCFPGALSLDRKGNLFVSDHFIETAGNQRLLMFPPLPPFADVPWLDPQAVKAFPIDEQGHWNATFEPAFDSQNRMVVGFNPYSGQRFLKFYSDPTALNPLNRFDPAYAKADGELNDFYAWPVAMTFDADDNLYVFDVNRKLLVYRKPLANIQYIRVVAPNGGEKLNSDSVTTIRWSALASVRAVNIEWQPFNTDVWQTIARNVPNSGTYQWTVPRLPGDQARIRISNAANPAQSDLSDAPFSVVFTFGWSLTPRIVCANGVVPLHDGTSAWLMYALWPPDPLQWNYAPASQVLAIQSSASVSGGYLAMMTGDIYFDYLTPVFNQAHPALVSGTYFYPSTPMIHWNSQNVFGVPPLPQGAYPATFYAPPRWCPGAPAIQQLRPAGGETVLVGDSYPIRWLSGLDKGAAVKVEYSINNGATWNLLTASTPNTGVYGWSVAGTPTTLARIRITSTSNASFTMTSTPFTIKFR